MPILPSCFYRQSDVVNIAKQLIGKWLFTQIGECPITGGMITETEAYAGAEDAASHAYKNLRTKRTEVLFSEGGVAYVYLCYGIHYLLNVVTNLEGIPHAVLIRSIQATHGVPLMLKRRGKAFLSPSFTVGPATVTQALGITNAHYGVSFAQPPLWIEDRQMQFSEEKLIAGPRVGVEYAGKDALLPWRFQLQKSCISNSLSACG